MINNRNDLENRIKNKQNDMQYCYNCKQNKTVSEFYESCKYKCKDCRKRYRKDFYLKNKK